MWRRIQRSNFCNYVLSNEVKWKKNKVAMVIGFIGTKYKGIQFNKIEEIQTIERVLENALYQIGCISDSNHESIHKISWSRSSRTDKGVHAARLVISAKLLLPPTYPEGIEDLRSKINQTLPEDIRVFSLTKVNQGFCARKTCNWREYEYHLPLAILPKNMIVDPNGIIEKLNEALKLMEGSQPMHNFHRAKRIHTSREPWRWIPPVQGDVIANDGTNNELGDGVKDEESSDSSSSEGSDGESHILDESLPPERDEKFFTTNYFHNWSSEVSSENLRTREKKSYNSILYLAETTLIPLSSLSPSKSSTLSSGDDRVIIFRFRGQAFLLHQIRIMVSAAVLYAMNIIPLFAIDFALRTPYTVHFPLAPACGLLLVSSGFSRNTSKQDYALSPDFCEIGDKVLMTSEQYHTSYLFQSQQIYRQLYFDWENDIHHQIQKWLSSWEYHTIPEDTLQLWKQLYDAQMQKMKEIEDRQHIIGTARVNKSQALYSEYLELKKNNSKGSSQLKIYTKVLLPNGVQTALIVRYRLSPSGKVVLSVIRSLAYAVARGDAPIFTSPKEVLDYVEKTGGIEHWMNEKQLSWII